MTNFEMWNAKFSSHELYTFNGNRNGLLWLKVRSICRAKLMAQFLSDTGISLSSLRLSEQSAELFGALEANPNGMQMLDDFLRAKNHEWYVAAGIDEAKLKEDLYKVHNYDWGGDRNNSLDKYLVSRFVKVVSNYDELVGRRAEIAENAWNYVKNSWYNNWTSYLIESLFKHHPRVVPAVGEIKSVDFFIDSYPLDLKVTYFPEQYMAMKLREKLGKPELTWLKQQAKAAGIAISHCMTESQQRYAIMEKMWEIGLDGVLAELKRKRREVVEEAQNDSKELMEWLYSNQGEMRFGAENRLFVVLVDSSDMSRSWKMKRAFGLIEPQVRHFLDNYDNYGLKEIDFAYKQMRYKTFANTIFVVK